VKSIAWVFAVASMVSALVATSGTKESWAVIVSGDTFGYLSPCGCVKPMSGGIRRRVTAIRDLTVPDRTLILDTGGLVKDQTRQSEIKAETLAQAMRLGGVDAVHLSASDRQLGPAMTDAVERLSQARLLGQATTFAKGPFVVAGIPGDRPDAAVRRLIMEATQADKVPVALLDGGLAQARTLAESFPELRLITFRAETTPAAEPIRVGKTWLITPGDKGKYVLRFFWNGVQFENLEVRTLGPDVHDHEAASRTYATYLQRVKDEHLFEGMARQTADAFAGNNACISCHQEEGKVWKNSRHADALATLEKENHDRDPDCVSCHVVGSEFTTGFMSRKETPQLTDVGCESCHGPGAKHAMTPKVVKMPKVGADSCMKCHNLNHSPTFNFDEYWKKIQHGPVENVWESPRN